MKPKLPIGVAILISLLLLVFGLVYGDVSGHADERARADALLRGESGLLTVIAYRAADGLNLCVVADRHLAADADVEALRAAAAALRKGSGALPAVKAGDQTLAGAFGAVAAKLRATPSFQQSERDRQYLEMLSADFSQYGQNEIFDAYNKAAEAFNQKLLETLPGKLARFLGVKPLELYA